MTTQTVQVPVPTFTFGDRVRRLRLDLGLTQGDFADSIGIARATVGKYELLAEPPRGIRLFRNSVALVYGADVADWIMGTTTGGVWARHPAYGWPVDSPSRVSLPPSWSPFDTAGTSAPFPRPRNAGVAHIDPPLTRPEQFSRGLRHTHH